MNAEAVAAATADAIDQVGQAIMLRRVTAIPGNKTIPFDVVLVGCVRGYQPHELTGTIAQGDREVTISDREIVRRKWPGPPVRNDEVLIDGKVARIEAVNTQNLGSTIVRHTMQVRGG